MNALEVIKNLIKDTKFEGNVYVVGGWVRDQILGHEPKDVDFLIDMPQGGIRFAQFMENQGASKPVVYERFGTVQFRFTDTEFEAVAPRVETYTEGSRKPEVSEGSLFDDVKRRDFTINSLLYNVSTEETIDMLNGKDDINMKIIRSCGDPDEIFVDDPIRILRAVRFACKYDFSLESSTLNSMIRHAHKVEQLSKERIREEFTKMILLNNCASAINCLQQIGCLQFISPTLVRSYQIEQNEHHDETVFDHCLTVMSRVEPTVVRRLAGLFHDIGKVDAVEHVASEGELKVTFHGHEKVGAEVAREELKNLTFDNKTVESVCKIIEGHMRLKQSGDSGENISDKALRKFVLFIGDDLDDALDIIHADNISHASGSRMPNQVPNIRKRLDSLVINKKNNDVQLPMNGVQVMAYLGIPAGKEVGEALDKIREAVIDNPNLSVEEAKNIIS